jgi:glycosyltransferase involved in cell wall biosynthesis
LARVLEREGFVPATYYVWQPGYQDTVARLKTQPIVYHCYDKYDRYVGSRAHEMRRQETWLARHAQLCVAASAELGEYLEELGARDVLILRHGVDVDRFRPGLTPADGLSGIPHPRIGVVARFNEGLDIATLEYLARQRPQWSLVLIGGQHFTDGHARERFGRLSALPNVHHVGPQPPNQVPNWLNGLDVALMCYDLAAWGPYNQPIKMYEYLACGLPVVSSNVRAARELETLVTCCDAAEEWVGAIEHALGANSPAAVSCRLAFARANTWDRRASELRSALAPVTRS